MLYFSQVKKWVNPRRPADPLLLRSLGLITCAYSDREPFSLCYQKRRNTTQRICRRKWMRSGRENYCHGLDFTEKKLNKIHSPLSLHSSIDSTASRTWITSFVLRTVHELGCPGHHFWVDSSHSLDWISRCTQTMSALNETKSDLRTRKKNKR
jgi:hypothetical protein